MPSKSFGQQVESAWNSFNLTGEWYECFACGMSHADCLHHNYGRHEGNPVYNSILNSVPLNNFKCHLPNHSVIKENPEWLAKTFRIVMKAVKKKMYKLKKIDYEFYELHKEIYLQFNLNI